MKYMDKTDIEIIPAILPKDYEDLMVRLNQINGLVRLVQIDVVDGIFAQNKTWPYTGSDEHFEQILHEDEGLPHWQEFDFEVDMMVANPAKEWHKWVSAGARRIIIHQESTQDLGVLIADIRSEFPKHESESVFNVEIGLAQSIDTPTETLFPYLKDIDFVQFMGIKEIGKQGNPFDTRVLRKIETLKEHAPETIISVDGGVSLETARMLILAGVNRLVVGSALFNSEDISETLELFKELTRE